MRELDRNRNKKTFDIQVADENYLIKNPYRLPADELQYELADQMYNSIRNSDTDVGDIAKNLGFKVNNIQNVKDHVFYNKHELDKYMSLGHESKYACFDPELQQALAWKRLEKGTHIPEDLIWIKHECAERHHELKYDAGYSESNSKAQSRYDGAPWDNDW